MSKNTTLPQTTPDDTFAALNAIAVEHMHIETLDTRHRDALDFPEVSVWGLKAALEAAYELGKRNGQPPVERSDTFGLTLSLEEVRDRIGRDLTAALNFEINISKTLALMATYRPDADLEGLAKNIRYNQQMKQLYTERAKAALEILGYELADDTDTEDLAQILDALE